MAAPNSMGGGKGVVVHGQVRYNDFLCEISHFQLFFIRLHRIWWIWKTCVHRLPLVQNVPLELRRANVDPEASLCSTWWAGKSFL